jgi:hypothetical protein
MSYLKGRPRSRDQFRKKIMRVLNTFSTHICYMTSWFGLGKSCWIPRRRRGQQLFIWGGPIIMHMSMNSWLGLILASTQTNTHSSLNIIAHTHFSHTPPPSHTLSHEGLIMPDYGSNTNKHTLFSQHRCPHTLSTHCPFGGFDVWIFWIFNFFFEIRVKLRIFWTHIDLFQKMCLDHI